jgi:hypothetical protein
VAFRRYVTRTKSWSSWSAVVVSASARSKRYITANGTNVQMRVRARNAAGVGSWTGVVTQRAGLPGPVPGTRAAAGERQVTLTWSAASASGSAVTGYRVHWRSYAAGAWSSWRSTVVPGIARSRVLTGLVDGRVHQFFVRAVNRWGAGAAGATVTATPQDVAPGAVTGLSVTTLTWGTVGLSWTNPVIPDLASVQVRRYEGTNAPPSLDKGGYVIPTGTGMTTVSDSGLVDGTTYSYSVFVVDKAGKVSPPRSITVITEPLPPPPTVTLDRSILPEMIGALYTNENEGRGYVGFVITAATDGTGEVTITLPTVTYVAGNPYRPGTVTTTFQTIQTSDPQEFGYISTTNLSCRSAAISSFTASEGVADQPITIAYDCPVGGELLLNVYPQLGWRGVNDENPQFQDPDPNDVYTFPVSATVSGVTVELPSPTLDVVSHPVILNSVPDQINYTRPVVLTDVTVTGTDVTFTGLGSDANNIPYTNTMVITGGVFVDGTGQVIEGVTPQINDPTALLTRRTVQPVPLEFTDCAAFGCPPTTIASVEVPNGAGITTSTGLLPPSSTTRWFFDTFALSFSGDDVGYWGGLCDSYGAPSKLSISGDERPWDWSCGGWASREKADLMLPAVGPYFCLSQNVVVEENPYFGTAGWFVTCLSNPNGP